MTWTGGLINTAHYAALIAEIAAVDSCELLQEIEAAVWAEIQAFIDSILSNIALLEPLLILLQIPDSLQAVITWITNLITYFIKPYLQPYIIWIQQLTQLEQQIAAIAAAIAAAIQRLGQCFVQAAAPVFTIPDIPAALAA